MGWFSNMLFGKTVNMWGVEPRGAPNISPQTVDTPTHDDTPPEMGCIRVEPHVGSDGKQLEVWICLANMGGVEVEITRIECLGQTTGPSRFLRPGEQHELEVYRGAVLTSDAEHRAHITYKSIASGDYYQAEYLVKYKYSQHEGNEQYTPYELDLQKPIKKL